MPLRPWNSHAWSSALAVSLIATSALAQSESPPPSPNGPLLPTGPAGAASAAPGTSPPPPPPPSSPPPPPSEAKPAPASPGILDSLAEKIQLEPPGPAKDAEPAPTESGRFEFGSYGRIGIASDLRGGTGRQSNIVAYGTRIDEDSYAELELRREDTFKDHITNKMVATLALFPPFFHFSGNEANNIAVRNLFDQATYGAYTLWVGSRMYRGDDIYLLDWWPLDNQNTVGGGVGVDLPKTTAGETRIAAHVGMQRLDNPTQFQQVPEVAPFGVTPIPTTVLDRPRVIETLKITQLVRNTPLKRFFDTDKAGPGGGPGFKFILYGEVHEISAGVEQIATSTAVPIQTPYPSDVGFLVGGEIAYWTGQRDTFVQLFFREARGLAAYDPLSEPSTFNLSQTTSGASETLIALGGNVEGGVFGLLYGGYLRFFRDADPNPISISKYDEGTLVVRPQAYFGEHWGLALEGSFQARRYAELDPTSGNPLVASEWRGGVMPYFSPAGRGSYKRPQLRAIYAITARNQAARDLYPAADVFSQRSISHYLGLQAEWWFNSSSYP
jgi:LamB porin